MDNRIDLSKTYKFGPEEISFLEFGEVTAKEMGELPVGDFSKMKMKDLYPIAGMLTGRPQSFICMLNKADTLAVINKTVSFLGE